jgi:hypothetical protein
VQGFLHRNGKNQKRLVRRAEGVADKNGAPIPNNHQQISNVFTHMNIACAPQVSVFVILYQ